MPPDNVDELKDKRICDACVGEAYLCALVIKERVEADCAYCDKHGFTMAIGDMAELVDQAFDRHYVRTSDQPDGFDYAMMKEGGSDWERDGEPVVYAIGSAAEIPDDAAEDIQAILEDQYSDYESAQMGEETAYDSDSQYETKALGSGDWAEEWRAFEKSLRSENRFFSPIAAAYLGSLFAGVEALKKPDGTSVVVTAGPDTAYAALFRARVFQAEGKMVDALPDLDRELGPPPALAALAGRMNARGIAVFYGATDAAVALAEIRPPVGSRVVTARFEIVRPLRLLDLAALGQVAVSGSIFDPAYARALEKAAFLDSFNERITRPVMPDDEALDYVITQAIADFLATDTQQPLDGLIYRSAQAPAAGVNVVLFHKAARVMPLERPKGTEVDSSGGYSDEDGWQVDYQVIERTPKPQPPAPPKPYEGLAGIAIDWPDDVRSVDDREISLRIALDTVTVHDVTAVQFQTEAHKVTFHRWEKQDHDAF